MLEAWVGRGKAIPIVETRVPAPSRRRARPAARPGGGVARFALCGRRLLANSQEASRPPTPHSGEGEPMAARMKKTRPGTRLQLGAPVLAAARALDTRAVKERLQRLG